MLPFLLCAAAHAAPPAGVLGVEYRPFSRGDLTWVAEGNTTGLAVGPLDGLVRSSLSAYGGVGLGARLQLLGSLGIARVQTTVRTGEAVTQRHQGVVRPGVDVRVHLLEGGQPALFALGGVHLDLPSARDASSGYTKEEQEAADQAAAFERARLGGIGGRLGLGGTVELTPALALGLQYAVQWQRSLLRGDDPSTVTSLLRGEAALLLQLQWPGREAAGD